MMAWACKRLILCVFFGSMLGGCTDAARSPTSAGLPGISPSLVRLGDDLQRTGDGEGAVALYRAAAGQNGRDAAALQRLGQAAMAQGDPGRAEQAFRAALVVDRSAETRQGLAFSLLAQGRAKEALSLLAVLASERPDPHRLRAYGVALDMAGRQADAQAVYRHGLELSPADANLHGNLALSLAATGQMEAALGEVRSAQLAPLPDPRQEVNSVLLLAVSGHEAEARQQGDATLGPVRTDAVLRQAAQVRAAPDAASRALAFGLLTTPRGSGHLTGTGPTPQEAARAGG